MHPDEFSTTPVAPLITEHMLPLIAADPLAPPPTGG